jgi:hypothetical protein
MSDTATVDTNFVVYAYVREDGTPYYIGKGRPDRPYRGKGRPCGSPPRERILILYKNIDEQTAFDWERKLIKMYGRKGIEPDGLLYNKSLGGEGTSGVVISEERRKQMSDITKERFKIKENNPMYGKKHSEETKKLLSERTKSQCMVGRNHPKINLHDWTHSDYGDHFSMTILELIAAFPDQNLKYSSLNGVAQGINLSSKGWRLLKNKGVLEEERFISIKKLCTWEHPVHGVYENTSAPDLVKLFPELNRQSLSNLSNGKIKEYKGWKVLNLNCNNHAFGAFKSDWVHEKHGVYLNYTVTQLCEQFKDLKLTPSKLRLVRLGKAAQHKGWRLSKE